MKKTRFTEEQIVWILQTDGTTTIEAAAGQNGVSGQFIYRWKRQFGNMEVADVRKLRQLWQENAGLALHDRSLGGEAAACGKFSKGIAVSPVGLLRVLDWHSFCQYS
jgi:putative transposase